MLIDVLKTFFRSDYLAKELVHPFYFDSIKIASDLQIHSRGLPPIEMLELARPNEETKFLLYRKNVYKPFTKTYWEKVAKTGQKIAKAEDFKINYQPAKKAIRLQNRFSLEDYTENSFPEFDSIANFWFSWAINLYYDDPNAVIAFWPRNLFAPDNVLREPYPYTFESTQVLEYVDGKYAVFIDSEKSEVYGGDNKPVKEGLIFHALDENMYIRAVQVGRQENYTFVPIEVYHNSGYLPALKVGRKIKERKDGRTLYESDLSPCLPYLDEAISLISDQQVNLKIHLHPEKWEIGDTTCPTCRGTKKRLIEGSKLYPAHTQDCPTCEGMGTITSVSQFGVRRYKASTQTGAVTQTSIPIPPAGYIERPIEILQFTKQEIHDNLIQALAAVNMEHLFDEPLVNSGVSKARDQQEFLSYIDSVGRHFVTNVLKPMFEFVNNWRYFWQGEKERYDNLPQINIPQKFDILTLGILQDRLAQAKQNKFSPEIVAGLEIEIAKREFGKDALIVTKLELKAKLDPLPYLTQTEKNESILNSASPATSYQKYVISCNVDAFITRAIEENPDFGERTYIEQMRVLEKYADEIKPLPAITVTMPDVPTQIPANDNTAA